MSIYAVCLVGLRVDSDKLQKVLYKKDLRRSCSCFKEVPKSKYCPECGEPVWKMVKVPIDGYGEDCKFLDFTLYTRAGNRHPEYISIRSTGYIGFSQSGIIDSEELDLPVMMEFMRIKLEPLGLWDAQSFGIHVFLYESC